MQLNRYLVLCAEESCRGLWFYRRTVAPAVTIITVSLIVLGAFLMVSQNLAGLLIRWRDRGQVQIFLESEVPPIQRQAIEAALVSNPAVEEFRLLDQETAAELFRIDFQELGEVLELLDENPLPASYAVTISVRERSEAALQALSAGWSQLPGVDGVQYDLQIMQRLEFGVRAVRLVGLLLGGTVLIAAIITTANVIRVLVIDRAREIEVTRLVGASEAVVRGRFLFEGALQGIIGGVVALVVLYAAYSLGLAYLDRQTYGFLAALPLSFLPLSLNLGLIAGGALTGLAGAWLAFGPGGGLRAGL